MECCRLRVLVALGLGLAILTPATPATADAARPGQTRSEVDAFVPPVDGVAVDIVGGDSFLRLRVQPGHRVEVPGYQGEPYLRVLPDGTVEENRRSPAFVLNQDRYGEGSEPVPVWTDDDEPEWIVTGTTGEALWHDHRVHWMARTNPPTISEDGLVQRWEVPVVVDGVEVVVQGSLYRVDGPGITWWLMALPAAGLGLWLYRRRPDDRRPLLAVAAVIGTATAIAHLLPWLALPPIARSIPVISLLATSGVLVSLVSWRWATPPYGAALLAGAGAGLMLAGWAGRAIVTAGVVPGAEVLWPLRLTLVASVGIGVTALLTGVVTVVRVPAADAA